jgi:hypothetical protein
MRRFGLAAFLALTLLLGVTGLVAYNLGVSAGAADAAIEAGAAVIYAPAAISPFGLIIGAFFLVLLIGFIARAFAGPRRHMGAAGWGRHMGPGHHRGDWDHETVPEPFRPMLERWHDDAHTAAGAKAPGADAGGASGGGAGGAAPPAASAGRPSA